MRKYKETAWWWYAILLCLSFFAGKPSKFLMPEFLLNFFILGLIVVFKGQTTLPWWSYIVALIMGTFITVRLLFCKTQKRKSLIFTQNVQPFSSIIVARLGSSVGTAQLMKMIAGVINPGRPVANLYVSSKLFILSEEISWLSLILKKKKKVFHVEPRC